MSIRDLINKIENKRIRVFLKEWVFRPFIMNELLDNVDDDIIRLHLQKSEPLKVVSIWENPEDTLAVKMTIKEKLKRNAQPSIFLTSFVYPILASIITAFIVSKWLTN